MHLEPKTQLTFPAALLGACAASCRELSPPRCCCFLQVSLLTLGSLNLVFKCLCGSYGTEGQSHYVHA